MTLIRCDNGRLLECRTCPRYEWHEPKAHCNTKIQWCLRRHRAVLCRAVNAIEGESILVQRDAAAEAQEKDND
ncbi:hypothetical protein LCGC14_1537400 [marine sediment metagenome]|uniref:Uncharacterized protein n=1 Tax=marine sediment metagenome TaxID=412755 RepID=A0A0F9LUX8_9ZZZZ